MEQGIWQEIEALHQKFQKLGISEAVDYEKYYLYSLIAHSTAIEGYLIGFIFIQRYVFCVVPQSKIYTYISLNKNKAN